jgi:nucleotide-binding universal stress UspA family protein
MSAIQRVLFPIDVSLNYQTLTASARRMFDRRNTEIIMLHAIEEPSRTGRGTEVIRAMAQMEFLARKEFRVARVSRRVERGRAADCIIRYAHQHEVDVILMCPGGLDSLRRNSLGHVSEEVLSAAPCAVWMEWMTGSVECVRNICCAIRLDDSDAAVLSRASEIAEQFGAEITIVHAVAPDDSMALLWDADAFEREVSIARRQADALREKFAPRAHVHVEGCHLDALVSRMLYRLDAGLLVSASQGEAVVAVATASPVLRLPGPRMGDDSRLHTAPELMGAA